MDPDYELNRIGYPEQVDRLVELLDNVWQDHVPVTISHNGIVVAVAVHPDDLDLLRRAVIGLGVYQSDDPTSQGSAPKVGCDQRESK